MECNGDDAAVGREDRTCGFESAGDVLKFAIHCDAKRLEGPRGEVNAAAMVRRGSCAANDLDEIGVRAERTTLPLGNDRAGDTTGEPFIPERAEYFFKLPLRARSENVRGGLGRIAAVAHINTLDLLETETAPGRLEMEGTGAEVEEDSGDRAEPERADDRAEIGIARSPQNACAVGWWTFPLEALPEFPEEFLVPFQGENGSGRPDGLQNSECVSPAVGGRVDVAPPRLRVEIRKNFCFENRRVERVHIPSSPKRSAISSVLPLMRPWYSRQRSSSQISTRL